MENYDPEFSKRVKEGDILVGGYNFGTGSSREQAATALKYRGIQAVIVGSASQTYMRNALNNGFLVIECPDLVDYMKNKYGSEKLTVYTHVKSKVNFKNSILIFDNNEFPISPIGAAAQELIVVGGLENWIINNLE
jgi:homoaconitate hydratase